jgi:phospholipid/cholesterol/gamma-HCH transport system permease protein
MTAPDEEFSSEEQDRESLANIVGEELESLLPFTAKFRRGMTQMGGMFVLGGRALSRLLRPPNSFPAIVYQVETLGARSLSIATLTAAFAGLVIAIQFAFFLARFGVQHTVGKVVVLTLFRELAPVLTALTVGGRIGSGIAAELGSMTVTEQVDAVRALGADPIKKLVVPRVYACLLVMPMLTILADVTGFVAGALVTKFEYDIPLAQFFVSALETVDEGDFLSGVGKSVVFGLIIAVVGCYKGLNVHGGTEGVGRATTQTVAVASVAVLLADFFLTKLLLTIQ